MSAKKLSIIIPTLNRPDQLSRLVDKIVIYAAPEVEVIVVDDSLERWKGADAETFKEGQINYIHRAEKLGVSSARNIGAKRARGEYLLFLDDDDDFTEMYFSDFLESINSSPKMVFCEMSRREADGSERIEKAKIDDSGNLIEIIFIPGAWLIDTDFFEKIDGYDERLTYAENTELFIRIQKENPTIQLISKPNFIYYPSRDGGSKNLRNMVDSLNLILDKHDSSLSAHVKHLYHQILGVNHMRFREFSKSRKNLILAFWYKPYRLATFCRFLIACSPPIARKLYSVTVKNA
jgi:GT2 family glycosyltransferase